MQVKAQNNLEKKRIRDAPFFFQTLRIEAYFGSNTVSIT